MLRLDFTTSQSYEDLIAIPRLGITWKARDEWFSTLWKLARFNASYSNRTSSIESSQISHPWIALFSQRPCISEELSELDNSNTNNRSLTIIIFSIIIIIQGWIEDLMAWRMRKKKKWIGDYDYSLQSVIHKGKKWEQQQQQQQSTKGEAKEKSYMARAMRRTGTKTAHW